MISPYSTKTVCSECNDDKAVAAYMSAIRTADVDEAESRSKAEKDALERRIEEVRLEGELKLHEHNEKERLKAVASLHRHRINNNILTTKCPHCSLAFVDWTMCFAVKCESEYAGRTIGCQKHFCGWCITGFSDQFECHEHVKVCRNSLNPGSYYGRNQFDPTEDFNRAQAPIRKANIERYLVDNNLTSKEREAVISAMQTTDLTPLGIRMN